MFDRLLLSEVLQSFPIAIVTKSQKVQLAWAIDIAVMNYRSEKKLKSGCC
jgi:hypothetical protein